MPIKLEYFVGYEIAGLKANGVILVVIAVDDINIQCDIDILPASRGASVEGLRVGSIRRFNHHSVTAFLKCNWVSESFNVSLQFQILQQMLEGKLVASRKKIVQSKFGTKVFERKCSFLSVVLGAHGRYVVQLRWVAE